MDTILNHYYLNHLHQDLYYIPQKAIFWNNKRMLIVSDLRFGKARHFRKSGIAFPALVHDTDFKVLDQLIEKYNPDSIVFLGDVFHSESNNQWLDLSNWIKKHTNLPVHLVKGNHDILPENLCGLENVEVHEFSYIIKPFIFTYKPLEEPFENHLYYISGHLHPAVSLKGKAKQNLNLACFYFEKQSALLPAFGNFTGNSLLKIKKEDLVYVITGQHGTCTHAQANY